MRRWAMIALVVGFAATGWAGKAILFDFEDGTQGWENEADRPDAAQHVTNRAHRGSGSLGFEHQFQSNCVARTLHVRVKDGFPKDLTAVAGFIGFSAWVYIPNGLPLWEAKMFARSGPQWDWGVGKLSRNLEPGWHQVTILKEEIGTPSLVQDLGVEVVNYQEALKSLILIDQVEMIRDTGTAPK